MLTTREHVKIDILQACAEQGLTLDETLGVVKAATARLEMHTEKQAGIKDILTLGGLVPTLAGKAVDLGATGAKALGTGLVLAPIGIGAGAGYMMGRGKGKVSDEDIQEVKKRELIDAYNRMADESERRSIVSARQRQRRSTPVRSLV